MITKQCQDLYRQCDYLTDSSRHVHSKAGQSQCRSDDRQPLWFDPDAQET